MIPDMQEHHEQALAEAADAYLQASEAKERAANKLAEKMRAAYRDNEQQSAILRASKHVWSREYLRVILGLSRRKSSDRNTPPHPTEGAP